jgi:electron transfer flavoprotein alpha subunit
VGPQLAELLDLPFLGGARQIEVQDDLVTAHCEHDDGWAVSSVELPAVISCAERLCAPAKVEQAGRDSVPAELIRRLTAHDLGSGPWGQAGSPTQVGDVRSHSVARERVVLDGPLIDAAKHVVAAIERVCQLDRANRDGRLLRVSDGWVRGERVVAVVCEPDRQRESRELLGAAARLAHEIGGRVSAIDLEGGSSVLELSSWGADEVIQVVGADIEQDVAHAIADWSVRATPWAILTVGTMWGREVASRLAVRIGAGLTGDAIDLSVESDRLVGWKPAFGGQLVAAVTSVSATQLVTIRPGVLPERAPRPSREVPTRAITHRPFSRVRRLDEGRVDELETLARSRVVIGIGAGVDPRDYPLLETLRATLNGEFAATRKVTDAGSLPRSRQLGLTGRSISPALYIAVGLSGKLKHTVGFRNAQSVLAINVDRSAPIFDAADLGIVADWRDVVQLLTEAFADSPLSSLLTSADCTRPGTGD